MRSMTFIKYVARPILLAQGCVLIGLSCLAAWDVAHNVADYMYDNHVTSVQLISGRDAIEALPNLSLAFYWEDIAGFPKYPNGTEQLARVKYDDEIRQWVDEAADDDLAALAGCAFFIDNRYVLTNDYHIECNTSQYDRVLGIETNLSSAMERPLRSFKQKVMGSMPATFVIDQLTPWSVTFTLPVASVFQDGEYEKVLLFQKKNESGVSFKKPSFTINDTPYDMKSVFRTVAADTTNIRLQIFISGFYDISRVHRDCMRNVTSDRDAVWMCRLTKVMQYCDCVPFTLRRLVPTAKRFCTERIYEQCWMSLNTTWPSIVWGCQNTKACVSRNYQLYATLDSYLMAFDYWLNLKISRSMSSISQFSESELTSLPQLLSQIGGSLGLYLGFSCFGMFQLLVVIVNCYTSRKKQTRRQSMVMPLMSMWISALSLDDKKSKKHSSQVNVLNDVKDLKDKVNDMTASVNIIKSKTASGLKSP